VEALREVVQGLLPDLAASVFVVVHIPSYAVSRLPEILGRAGSLPVAHAQHGDKIVSGRIYVAPPDRHMLVRDGEIELSHGPRENHSRPAIDPLFRSAARAYGSRTIGIVLSGALYDGAAGLASVKAHGGTAIVQDPDEAVFPSMPNSALDLVDVDLVLPARIIGQEVGRLIGEEIKKREPNTMINDEERMRSIINGDFKAQAEDKRTNVPTMYTCPDCGGVLWQAESGLRGHFRCHVGHAYAPEVLLGQKSEELEAALWSCVRLLKEKATLTRQSATRSAIDGHDDLAARIEETARINEEHARLIRELLESMPSSTDSTTAILAALGSLDHAGADTT
jgi:two-component system chemotaxis response regulator CheB